VAHSARIEKFAHIENRAFLPNDSELAGGNARAPARCFVHARGTLERILSAKA
jgi:hypothetical protein